MEKEKFITKNVTEFPIGDSGFYFSQNKIDADYIIDNINHICGSLYEISVMGVVGKTCWSMYTLDLDDKEIHPGYVKKISESLYAIFDIPSIDVGWPAEDIIIIKNVISGKKIPINFDAPADENIVTSGDFFILSGSIVDIIDGEQNIKKEWKVFLNKDGKIVYKGFCWEYQLLDNKIFIKKFKSSKKFTEINLN